MLPYSQYMLAVNRFIQCLVGKSYLISKEKHCSSLMNTIIHGNNPSYLNNILPPNVSYCSNYALQNVNISNHLPPIFMYIQMYPSSIRRILCGINYDWKIEISLHKSIENGIYMQPPNNYFCVLIVFNTEI